MMLQTLASRGQILQTPIIKKNTPGVWDNDEVQRPTLDFQNKDI